MPALEPLDLADAVRTLQQASTAALQAQSAEDFELVEHRLNQFAATVRELQQSMWATEAKQTIRNLEAGQPLNEADYQVIHTFIVSDAEHYLAQENNFQDWVQELGRLFGDMTQRLGTLDRESIGALRGVLQDATRLVPDIRNYLEEKRRIKLFQAGLNNLDDTARATLVRLLKEQLASPNV
ncbi:MAG: hypothetical protein PVJ57_19190 [Phycisphaerae bacterium]|jgi:hypothetical protein